MKECKIELNQNERKLENLEVELNEDLGSKIGRVRARFIENLGVCLVIQGEGPRGSL